MNTVFWLVKILNAVSWLVGLVLTQFSSVSHVHGEYLRSTGDVHVATREEWEASTVKTVCNKFIKTDHS